MQYEIGERVIEIKTVFALSKEVFKREVWRGNKYKACQLRSRNFSKSLTAF